MYFGDDNYYVFGIEYLLNDEFRAFELLKDTIWTYTSKLLQTVTGLL